MLTAFRNLDGSKKVIIMSILAAILIVLLMLVGFLFRGDGEDKKPQAPLPYATAQATDNIVNSGLEPTAVPTTAKPTETPKPVPTGPGSEIVYGETTLSVDEQQEVQSVAKDSIISYFLNNKGESLDSRNARLGAYFTKESGAYDEKSFSEEFSQKPIDNENYVISKGSIDYVDPAGGSQKLYKVVVGVTYRIQFNESGKNPQILERNGVYTLLLSKTSGSWKVTSINPNQ